MKTIFLLICAGVVLYCIGCSCPQTFQAEYYENGLEEMKEDLDDVTGARTL